MIRKRVAINVIDRMEKFDKTKIAEIIEQIDVPPKVTIPEWIAAYLEYKRDKKHYSLARTFEASRDEVVDVWLRSPENQETFAQAWLFGYEIKKEPMYSVAIPVGCGYYKTLCADTNGNLCLSDRNYISINKIKQHNSHVPGGLTEKRIKDSVLSWAWQFAEEVKGYAYE